MTVRRASRGLQLIRALLAVGALALGVLFSLDGSWLTALVMLFGAVAAGLAFRKGQWDPEQATQAAKEYAYPRLLGLAGALILIIVGVALGLID